MERITYKVKDINQIPNISGLYFFYNKETLLYIGKAKLLKNRIKQHYKENKIILQSIKKLLAILGKEIIDIQTIFMWTNTIQTAQHIDLQVNKITHIQIQLIPHHQTHKTERELIQKLHPKLNYQTLESNSLDSLFMFCNKLDNLLLNKIW